MVLFLPVQRSSVCGFLAHRAGHKLCAKPFNYRTARCRVAQAFASVAVTTETTTKKTKNKSRGRNRFREDKDEQAAPQPQPAPPAPTIASSVSSEQLETTAYDNHKAASQTPISQPVAEVSNIVPFDGARHRALVLDAAYRPINVITWIKAVKMDMAGRAEVLEYYSDACVTSSVKAFPMPAVVRARKMLNLDAIIGNGKVSLTRKNVMLRDKFTCLYCGCKKPPGDLSIDHVQPISKGGKNTWDNLATACKSCNQRKGNLTLKQVGWKLRGPLRQPTPYELGNIVQGVSPNDMTSPPPEWVDYLLPYIRKLQGRHGTPASHQNV